MDITNKHEYISMYLLSHHVKLERDYCAQEKVPK